MHSRIYLLYHVLRDRPPMRVIYCPVWGVLVPHPRMNR